MGLGMVQDRASPAPMRKEGRSITRASRAFFRTQFPDTLDVLVPLEVDVQKPNATFVLPLHVAVEFGRSSSI